MAGPRGHLSRWHACGQPRGHAGMAKVIRPLRKHRRVLLLGECSLLRSVPDPRDGVVSYLCTVGASEEASIGGRAVLREMGWTVESRASR